MSRDFKQEAMRRWRDKKEPSYTVPSQHDMRPGENWRGQRIERNGKKYEPIMQVVENYETDEGFVVVHSAQIGEEEVAP